MIENYLQYLSETFDAIEDEYGKDYVLKTIPDDFRILFSKMVEKNKLKWKIQTHQINVLHTGFDEIKINQVKERVKEIKKSNDGLIVFEDIPAWYYEFLKVFSGMTIVRSNIIIDNGFEAAENTLTVKPESLDGLFYIGQYDGLQTVPIFVNTEGNVFAFSAKKFRSYDNMAPTEKNFRKYRKTRVPLIAYWESMDEFLLSETKRLLDLYLADPQYGSSKKVVVPHNVTPEILNTLHKAGKIIS